MYHCVQVRVQYAKVPYKNGTNAKSINDNDWVDLRRIDVVENKVSYSPNKNNRVVCNKTKETGIHYHLQVQANPKKMAQKNRCYF